jgi:hypothetical protein
VVWKDLNVPSYLLGVPTPQGREGRGVDGVDDDKLLIEQQHHQQQLGWLSEFERLLYQPPLPSPQSPANTADDDSALVWGVDGGQEELARRRQRRIDAAIERGGYSVVPT